MKNNNPAGELIGLIKDIAQSGTSTGDRFEIGVLKAGGKIDVNDATLSPGDYTILQSTIIIDGQTAKFPSFEDQTITLTYTHPHATVPSTESKTIKFPKIPVGAELIMLQINDGDYVVFGEV
jgi:hypothetical protein